MQCLGNHIISFIISILNGITNWIIQHWIIEHGNLPQHSATQLIVRKIIITRDLLPVLTVPKCQGICCVDLLRYFIMTGRSIFYSPLLKIFRLNPALEGLSEQLKSKSSSDSISLLVSIFQRYCTSLYLNKLGLAISLISNGKEFHRRC